MLRGLFPSTGPLAILPSPYRYFQSFFDKPDSSHLATAYRPLQSQQILYDLGFAFCHLSKGYGRVTSQAHSEVQTPLAKTDVHE